MRHFVFIAFSMTSKACSALSYSDLKLDNKKRPKTVCALKQKLVPWRVNSKSISPFFMVMLVPTRAGVCVAIAQFCIVIRGDSRVDLCVEYAPF
jgi:hypothetical protein